MSVSSTPPWTDGRTCGVNVELAADTMSADCVAASVTASTAERDSGLPQVFLGLWIFMLLYLSFKLRMEWHRYNHMYLRSTTKKHLPATFGTYMRYRLGHWYSWTSGSSAILLFGLSVMLLALGGLLHSFLASSSISDSLWASWIWIVAPDGGNSAQPGGYVVGMLVSIGGMLIFALLLSIITSAFEEQLQKLRKGAIRVVEGDHIVILGWKPTALEFIDEICIAAEGRGGETIVCLTPLPKPEVEEIFRDGKVNIRNSKIVVRSGYGHCREDLERAAVPSARLVLVLSQLSSSREEADSSTLRVLLALSSQGWPSHPEAYLVVECCLVRNQQLFQSLASRHIEVLAIEDFVGELMVEASRHPGLIHIINHTFGFDGDEFYITDIENLSGCVFRDLLFAFPQALIVGIAHLDDGHIQLAPPMDLVLRGDERIVLLAEDATVLPKRLLEGGTKSARTTRMEAAASLKHIAKKVQSGKRLEELIIILGWNEAVGSMIRALDQLVAKGSEVVVYSPRPVEERDEWLHASQKRTRYWFENVKVSHLAGSLGARYKLDDLPLERASRIFILAENSAPTPDSADGQTVAAILQVRDILLERQGRNPKVLPRGSFVTIESERQSPQVIMPQILNKETEQAIRASGLTDCIDSTRLAARVMASVCETPELSAVFQDLLSETGVRFSIRKPSDFITFTDEVLGNAVSFNELLAAAASAGEILIGWKKAGLQDAHADTWEINPKARRQKHSWPEGALLVTLSPSVKEHESLLSASCKKVGLLPKLRASNEFRRRSNSISFPLESCSPSEASPTHRQSGNLLHQPLAEDNNFGRPDCANTDQLNAMTANGSKSLMNPADIDNAGQTDGLFADPSDAALVSRSKSLGNPIAVDNPGHKNDIVSSLSRLTDLHRDGALTDKEFSAAKARLLHL